MRGLVNSWVLWGCCFFFGLPCSGSGSIWPLWRGGLRWCRPCRSWCGRLGFCPMRWLRLRPCRGGWAWLFSGIRCLRPLLLCGSCSGARGRGRACLGCRGLADGVARGVFAACCSAVSGAGAVSCRVRVRWGLVAPRGGAADRYSLAPLGEWECGFDCGCRCVVVHRGSLWGGAAPGVSVFGSARQSSLGVRRVERRPLRADPDTSPSRRTRVTGRGPAASESVVEACCRLFVPGEGVGLAA